jgi:hypothetical protein
LAESSEDSLKFAELECVVHLVISSRIVSEWASYSSDSEWVSKLFLYSTLLYSTFKHLSSSLFNVYLSRRPSSQKNFISLIFDGVRVPQTPA